MTPQTLPHPGLTTMLWRGARRRCAWCGGRGAFLKGWFRKQPHCRSCGIGWQRGYEGFELGAMTVNVILSFGLLIVGLVVGIVLTLPDVQVRNLVIELGIAAVLLPLFFYPISYTLWQGVDLMMHPPIADDFALAVAAAPA